MEDLACSDQVQWAGELEKQETSIRAWVMMVTSGYMSV